MPDLDTSELAGLLLRTGTSFLHSVKEEGGEKYREFVVVADGSICLENIEDLAAEAGMAVYTKPPTKKNFPRGAIKGKRRR